MDREMMLRALEVLERVHDGGQATRGERLAVCPECGATWEGLPARHDPLCELVRIGNEMRRIRDGG